MVDITKPSGTKVTILTSDDEYTVIGEERSQIRDLGDQKWLRLTLTDEYFPDGLTPIDDRQADDWKAIVSVGGDTVSGQIDRVEPHHTGGAVLCIKLE